MFKLLHISLTLLNLDIILLLSVDEGDLSELNSAFMSSSNSSSCGFLCCE